MLIANPIYDTVFKRLMENERVARFFISTLTGDNIEEVRVQPQEFTYVDQADVLTVFRLDFVATVRTDDGERKKVLIEIQKARNIVDLMRFRNYLAEQYRKEEAIDDDPTALPITTIYILGFNLPEIDSPCVRVARQYVNLIDQSVMETKSDFIEKLTHDSYLVQVERITDRYQTSLDKLLSVFEQRNFIDEARIIKEYAHEADVEEVRLITDILHHTGTSPEERREIEKEREAWRTVQAMMGRKEREYLKQLAEKEKELRQKNEALEEKNEALKVQERLIEELKKKLDEKD